MADAYIVGVAVIIGLVAVFVAILERGYKRYLEEKKIAEGEGKTLQFNMLYLTNMVVTTGVSAAVVAALPSLIAAVNQTNDISVISVITNAATGYLLAYRLLDGLNSSTENKLQVAKALKEANVPVETAITAEDKPKP